MNLGNFGKVILGQNKEILSLNSGQNRMPEEEYKSLNEVLDFDDFFVLCVEKKKKQTDFICPGKTPVLPKHSHRPVWRGAGMCWCRSPVGKRG